MGSVWSYPAARARDARNQQLGTYLQMTQRSIAQLATEIDARALLVYGTARTKDVGTARVSREMAMVKWFATESAGCVSGRAVQLFGGRGVKQGELVERLYRDVRALRIYEGVSEIQQPVIARAAPTDRES